MMVRFFTHGDGSGGAAVNYLLAEKVAAYTEDRQRIPGQTVRRHVLPEVLSGGPDLTCRLIDSTTRRWRYTSGVVAFHADDDPSPDLQAAVMRDFEDAAFAGLERDQANILWVRHVHMGNVELHFLIPRVELYGNRSFNPAPPGSEPYFNSFRDYWNAREGWAGPDDPTRKRMVKPVFDVGDRLQIKETIQTLIALKIEAGEVRNHDDVRAVLAGLDGLEFKPLTEKQLEKRRKADAEESRGGKPRKRDTRITMRVAGTSDSQNTFRLEDRIFHEDWTADEYFAAKPASEGREPVERNRSADAGDVNRLRAAFVASVERRAARNSARYARPRRAERVNPRPDGQQDRGSGPRDQAGDGGAGGEPEGMADRDVEDDAAVLSGRGIADLLGAYAGGAADISRDEDHHNDARFDDLRPTRDDHDTWPWRIGAGGEASQRGRARQMPDTKHRRWQRLHRDRNDEVSHGAHTVNALRDRSVMRCRRTEQNLRDWFEKHNRFTDRIREFEARIQSVRSRFGNATGWISETAGRISETLAAVMKRRTILHDAPAASARPSEPRRAANTPSP
jgi:hypothetical protein